MKIISIILAVLILGLSISPIFNFLCCSSPSQNTQEVEIHSHCNHHTQTENSSHENDGEQEQNHDCNSFCACVCCNNNIVVHNPLIVSTATISYNEPPIPFFFFQYSLEYFPSIWQPPQIG